MTIRLLNIDDPAHVKSLCLVFGQFFALTSDAERKLMAAQAHVNRGTLKSWAEQKKVPAPHRCRWISDKIAEFQKRVWPADDRLAECDFGPIELIGDTNRKKRKSARAKPESGQLPLPKMERPASAPDLGLRAADASATDEVFGFLADIDKSAKKIELIASRLTGKLGFSVTNTQALECALNLALAKTETGPW
jgi:hypothetical protein